jgi:Putative prokaryotic signal transducing protein
MQDDLDLVPVASYDSLSEAEVARSLLDAEGIDVVVQDQPLASLLPPVALANGGLTLLVAPDELERAREVLAAPDDAEADGDPDAEALAEPEASGEDVPA